MAKQCTFAIVLAILFIVAGAGALFAQEPPDSGERAERWEVQVPAETIPDGPDENQPRFPGAETAAAPASAPGPASAWGYGAYKALGNGGTANSNVPLPVSLPAGTTVTDIDGSINSSIALTSTGSVLAWGTNYRGQLGDGTNTDSTTPVQVQIPPGTAITAVCAGYEHCLALTSTGRVLAWGLNADGQLGNGTNSSSNAPVWVSIPSGTTITAIGVGSYHSLAITSTGSLLAWGDNLYGQLGNGTNADSNVPVAVSLPSGTTVTAVARGSSLHSLARTSAGGVLAWGWNIRGQLGNGTNTDSNVPVAVLLPPVTAVAAGAFFSLAVTNLGGVMAWGHNQYGQLGNGSTADSNVPVTVSLPSGTLVTSAAAGAYIGLALTNGGLALAWGDNAEGALGDGTNTERHTPVQVHNPGPVLAVAAGNIHSLAIYTPCTAITVTNPATTTATACSPFSQTFTQSGGTAPVTFSTLSALPAGLTLASDGTLAGTPTQVGTFPITVTATDKYWCTGTGSVYNLAISCPTITLSVLPNGSTGSYYSSSVEASPTGAYTYALTAGSLPPGLSLDTSTGAVTGTPTAVGIFNFTIGATGWGSCTGSRGYTVQICPVITVTPSTLPNGTRGTYYYQVIGASGGSAPYTVTQYTGTIPTGLTLSSDGQLYGTPTVAATFTFSVWATDTSVCRGYRSYTVTIACPTVTLWPSGLPSGTAGAPYPTVTFSQTGGAGTITWTEAGPLPTGMTFDPVAATLAGTPTQTGNFPITVQARDADGCTGSQAYTVSIACPTVVTNLDDSGEGSLRWVVQWTCDGATVTFAPGLAGSITLATGAIPINRPLTIQGPGASVLAVDGAGLDRVFYHTAGSLSISGLTIRNGYGDDHGGGIYSTGLLSLTGCVVSGNRARATLPNPGGGGIFSTGGLTLDRCTISGNRMENGGYGGGAEVNGGLYTLTNTTFSGNYCSGAGAFMALNTEGTLLNCTITNNSTSSYNTNPAGFFAMNGTIHLKNSIVAGNTSLNQYGLSGPPLDDQGGNLLSGDPVLGPLDFYGGPTPTHPLLCGSPALDIGVAGYPATDQRLVARPQNGVADSGAFEANIFLSPGTLPAGLTGTPYGQSLTATGGAGAYTFTAVGTLPTGLSLEAGGQLTGTPTALGSWTFNAVAWDASGHGGVCRYTVAVTCGPISISPSSLPNGTAGVAYPPVAFSQTGGVGTIIWSRSGALPAGMSFNTATASLSGTPSVNGVYPFTVGTMDTNGCTGAGALSITIDCPAISLAALPGGTANTPYGSSAAASPAGTTYTYALTGGSLPPGLTLNTSTGAVTGTPTTNGTYNFAITATGWGTCTGSQAYAITIACPTITLAALPGGTANTPYSSSAAASPTGTTYSYAVTDGSLPPGLTLNTSTGAVTGTPTTNGTYDFTITATGWGTCADSQSYALTIACPTITLAALATAGTANSPYSSSAAASPVGTTYTYAVTAGSLPPGLILNSSTGAVTGTPTTNGTYNVTITATGWGTCTGSQAYTITIACPTIALAALAPSGTANSPYGSSAAASPIGTTYTYAVTAGSLPPGLSLNTSTGAVTGTPTTNGTYDFTVTATGWGTCSASQGTTITIACPTITLAALTATGTASVPYGSSAAASPAGTTYTYAVTVGSLPPGLTLNTSTGAVTGVPTTNGTYDFTIEATGWGTCPGSRAYLIAIACPAIIISPPVLPGSYVGAPYAQTLTADPPGGAFTYIITAGMLPPGLTLAANGQLSGTPSAAGTFSFTVKTTGWGTCSGSRGYTVAMVCPAVVLSPEPSALPAAQKGSPYAFTLAATGGTGPYTFAEVQNALPPGLTLAPSGLISGTPTAAGNYAFTVQAADLYGCHGAKNYELNVHDNCAAITVSPAALPSGKVSVAYSRTVSATGGTAPYTFAVTSGLLPPGLTLNASTGLIAGRPTAAGSFAFTITATDSHLCSGSRSYTIAVCSTITLSPASPLPAGKRGVAYARQITASGGTAPYAFSVTAGLLPPGLTLSPTGFLAGTPLYAGTYSFTVKATDSIGCAGTRAYTLTINP